MPELRLKNYLVAPTYNLLMELKLKGKQSRMRTRFANLLRERFTLIESEKKMIANELGVELDNNGVPIKFKDDATKEEYNKQLMELMDEDYIIEVTADKKEMIQVVKDAILNCDIEFSGNDAWTYDAICECFEGV